MQECRCSKCSKLLGKIEGKAEIVCTRCKVMNAFNVPLSLHEFLESDEVKHQYEMFCKINGIKGETLDVQVKRNH